ncbi:hypothetical protein S2091_1538 [Solimicrobium silvestre]|uniref:Uncharacterized protein n=1 Tax=Solimicrobium silvestre TaxID=2099400 RepID=A0A2S9H1S7_9BURK|nr:hypothetical protein S2091_1538 [Solimicrobium silvestre]
MLDFQHVCFTVSSKVAHQRLGVRGPITALTKSTSGAVPRTHHQTTVSGSPVRFNIYPTIVIGIDYVIRNTWLPGA